MQPGVRDAVQGLPAHVEWVYGRDGSLTGRTGGGEWWGGCSLPRRAAEAMLRGMAVGGRSAVLVCPVHGAQVLVALEKLGEKVGAERGLVVVVPEVVRLRVMLSCEDFSEALRGERLWFAVGSEWERELAGVFERWPGLAVPQQMVRTVDGDEGEVEAVVAGVQRVLSGVAERRGRLLREIHAGLTAVESGTGCQPVQHGLAAHATTEKAFTHPSPRRSFAGSGREGAERAGGRVWVVAPGRFRLWDSAGMELGEVLGAGAPSGTVELFDPDRAVNAGPLALAMAVRGCDAIVTADVGRADLAGVVPEGVAWVTWVTAGRVPGFVAGQRGSATRGETGVRDGVLVADEAWVRLALEAGWPAERVGVARWPGVELPVAPAGGPVALIHDTCGLEPGEAEEKFSSHRVLWEMIRSELLEDPFRLGEDVAAYLAEWIRRVGIAAETLDRGRFVERLILPAWHQGLARELMGAGVPVRLYGAGWGELGEFREHAAGAVRSREELLAAAGSAAGLVDLMPGGVGHAVERLGRVVVRGRDRRGFVEAAKRCVAGACVARSTGGARVVQTSKPTISWDIVQRFVDRVW
jgi:hypothetical protein